MKPVDLMKPIVSADLLVLQNGSAMAFVMMIVTTGTVKMMEAIVSNVHQVAFLPVLAISAVMKIVTMKPVYMMEAIVKPQRL